MRNGFCPRSTTIMRRLLTRVASRDTPPGLFRSSVGAGVELVEVNAGFVGLELKAKVQIALFAARALTQSGDGVGHDGKAREGLGGTVRVEGAGLVAISVNLARTSSRKNRAPSRLAWTVTGASSKAVWLTATLSTLMSRRPESFPRTTG